MCINMGKGHAHPIADGKVPPHIFKEAVAHAFNHIVITDIDGFIVYANQAAERMTGYTFEEMKGNTPRLWGRQMSLEFYKELWDTLKIKKEPIHAEIKNKRKNGELYYAMATISPILDKAGEPIAFIGLEEDITKLKQYAEDLEELVAERTRELDNRVRELMQLKQEKDAFITSASHQLQTPASVIRMQLELLKSDLLQLPQSEEAIEGLASLEENNKRVIDIMNDLFKMIELGEGYRAAHLKPVVVQEVVGTILKSYADKIKEQGITVTTTIPENILVMVDESRFKYILLNLIDNAVTYSHANGTMEITAREEDAAIVITVADSGIGIPDEEQVHIFDKFFRAKNAYIKKTVGTGLGLAISKIITEGHGGKITFTSEEGKGSTFMVTLPLKQVEEEQ